MPKQRHHQHQRRGISRDGLRLPQFRFFAPTRYPDGWIQRPPANPLFAPANFYYTMYALAAAVFIVLVLALVWLIPLFTGR
ncbi:MAG TPA: hypothetical protein VF812_07670 [Ktedonobacterales bacterium]